MTRSTMFINTNAKPCCSKPGQIHDRYTRFALSTSSSLPAAHVYSQPRRDIYSCLLWCICGPDKSLSGSLAKAMYLDSVQSHYTSHALRGGQQGRVHSKKHAFHTILEMRALYLCGWIHQDHVAEPVCTSKSV